MKRDFGEAMHQKEEVLKVSINDYFCNECRNVDNDWIQSARSKWQGEKELHDCIVVDSNIMI